MTYPPPPPGYPGGQPHDPYGQQPDPYGQPSPYGQQPPPDPYGQQPPPDPYGQQPQYHDPYAPQPDPYASHAPTSGPAAGGGWGSPPQSGPAGGYNPSAPMTPMSGPPGHTPMSGPPGQPHMGGPPGQPPMGGGMGPQQPMFGMPPQPEKKNNTGIIVGAVLGVVLLLAVGTVLVFTLGGDDEPVTTQPTTEEPTEGPSEDPTPSEDPGPETVSYLDFASSWSGDYQGESLSATYVNGWDYASCSEIAIGSTLEDEGCQYAVEVVHEAEGGDFRIGQMILALEDSTSAGTLQTDLNSDEFQDDYIFKTESMISNFEEGLWIADPAGSFVVITVVTRSSSGDTDLVEPYLYARADETTSTLRAY